MSQRAVDANSSPIVRTGHPPEIVVAPAPAPRDIDADVNGDSAGEGTRADRDGVAVVGRVDGGLNSR